MDMLVLSRKLGEQVVIAEDIVVTVTEVCGGKVRLGIEAPKQVRILRGELLEEPEERAFRTSWNACEQAAGPVASAQRPSELAAQPTNGARHARYPTRRLRSIPR
jgi:carbon storage regulator